METPREQQGSAAPAPPPLPGARRPLPRLKAAGYLAAAVAGVLVARSYAPPSSPPAPQAAYADPILAADTTEAGDTVVLAGLQDKFEAIARRVSPSVVSISASVSAVDADSALRREELNPEKLEALLDRTTRMVGTGFVIDPDGYILTNEHVVGEAETVWVTTDDRKVYPAIVVGSDPRADLAVLKIPAAELPAVRFAPYGAVKRGQWAVALGNPYGLATEGENCMSVGIISALDRSLPKLARKENRLYSNLIQTTAQINPGNSGGPLFDLNGDVIGLTTAVILPEKKTNGIGFAMPITPQLMASVRDIKEGKEVVYGYLGVAVSTPSQSERRRAGIEADVGVRVDNVEADSPAAACRLRERDVLVQVDGEALRDSDHFVHVIGSTPVDQAIKLAYYRDGKLQTTTAFLRRRALPNVAVTRESRRLRWQGLLLGPVPEHWAEARAAGRGEAKEGKGRKGLMVMAVSSRSHFARESLALGDIVTAVGGRAVADVTELQKIINDLPADQCELTVAGKNRAVVLLSD